MKVSFFKHIKNVTPFKELEILDIFEFIRCEKWSKQISSIRLETNKEERNKLKAKLTNFTTCGKFTSRANSNLKKHSGLAMLDFDHVKDLEPVRKKIDKDNYTFASFISTSGDGLKVVVKIPKVKNNDDY